MRSPLLTQLGWTAAIVVLATTATLPSLEAAPLIRQQTRCGWIDNPTPANWWLTDGYGEWIIGVQGGRQAEGMDNLPDFSSGWVETNGHYGYGCGCITGAVDVRDKRILRIDSVKQKTISACKADKMLPPRD
jgi:hypothetical protein